MRVRVDRGLCEANGVCMEQAPEVFELTEDDELVVLQERPPEAVRDRVAAAVRFCPRQALSIEG